MDPVASGLLGAIGGAFIAELTRKMFRRNGVGGHLGSSEFMEVRRWTDDLGLKVMGTGSRVSVLESQHAEILRRLDQIEEKVDDLRDRPR